MPEGDTIHRTAQTLRAALVGQPITAFEAPRLVGRRPRPGQVVRGVESRGKHLLIHVAGRTAGDDGRTAGDAGGTAGDDCEDLTLRTHLRMRGTWHVYRPGERWWRPRSQARVTIETPQAVAVCFNAPVVEVVPTSRIDRHPELVRLGPDLTRADADVDAAVRRARSLDPSTPVGVALLDQRIACGVGNVYRSEVLHAVGLAPSLALSQLDDTTLHEVLTVAARMLRANLDGYPRVTTAGSRGPRLAVYGRAGRPCATCGTAIRFARLGAQARGVYWCPACQTTERRRRTTR